MQKGVLIDFALRLWGGNDENGRYTARFRHLAGGRPLILDTFVIIATGLLVALQV